MKSTSSSDCWKTCAHRSIFYKRQRRAAVPFGRGLNNTHALLQTQALYKQLIGAGYRVIFLTGRKDIESDATRANLISVGYTVFDTLITRVPAEYNLTATAYKSARRTQLVEQEGYNIVGCVGDQWSDLHGPYTGFKVKLPNYIYYLP